MKELFHGGLYEPEKYQITIKEDVLPHVCSIYCYSVACGLDDIFIYTH